MNSATDTAGRSSNLHKFTHPNALYQWHLRAFLDVVYDRLQSVSPVSVLDAGCGEGFVIHYLAQKNPHLKFTGVDLSEEAIRYAQAHHGENATFRKGNLYKLPFSDNSFDLVLCSEVLEHLEEPDKAILQLKRVARRHVLITVPHEPYFKWFNDLGRLVGISPDPGHVHFWTKKSFPQFMNQHFDQVDVSWKHTYQIALATL